MLKGLAITPPVIGRISIGKVIEKNGKRLPEKDDQFTITSQIQGKEGWLLHPLDEQLKKAQGGKIRSIPIRLMFNDPSLSLRADYTLFDRDKGRPICVGNGESCRRWTDKGMQSLPCLTPDACELGLKYCKPYGRLNVLIGDHDPLGSFIFRTTGFNSIRTLSARLTYFKAISGNRLASMPLELRLRGKSTRMSHGSTVYYVDICLREGLTLDETLIQTKKMADERMAAGFEQETLDEVARVGFANGQFEDSSEENESIAEEFFNPQEEANAGANSEATLL